MITDLVYPFHVPGISWFLGIEFVFLFFLYIFWYRLLTESEWKCYLLSCVWLFANPWTIAHQAPLPTGFSRQEHRSGLPFPLQGIFQTQGFNLGLLHCRRILYRLSHQGSPQARTLWYRNHRYYDFEHCIKEEGQGSSKMFLFHWWKWVIPHL